MSDEWCKHQHFHSSCKAKWANKLTVASHWFINRIQLAPIVWEYKFIYWPILTCCNFKYRKWERAVERWEWSREGKNLSTDVRSTPKLPELFSSAVPIQVHFKWMHSTNMEGNSCSSALYYHAVVGFRVDCTDMETLEALHLVIQTTIAFPPLRDFSTELW